MKKVTLFFALILAAISINSCTKSGNSTTNVTTPAVVGKWAMTNISGYMLDSMNDSTGDRTTFFYNQSTKTMMEVDKEFGAPPYYDTTTIIYNTELWTLNSDNTYSIYEIVAEPMIGSPTVYDTATGTGSWAFLSGSSNTGLVLLGGVSTTMTSNDFTISSITGNQMILTFTATQSITGEIIKQTQTITFSRQ